MELHKWMLSECSIVAEIPVEEWADKLNIGDKIDGEQGDLKTLGKLYKFHDGQISFTWPTWEMGGPRTKLQVLKTYMSLFDPMG